MSSTPSDKHGDLQMEMNPMYAVPKQHQGDIVSTPFPTVIDDASGERIYITYDEEKPPPKYTDLANPEPATDAGGEAGPRGKWDRKIEFILSAIGYAVGLGNVWRFPYLCHMHGGGAFLVPYIIMLICVGLPLFFMEIAFGQFASLGLISIWNISPLFRGLGFGMCLISFILSLYYTVLVAQCLLYLGSSFTDQLKWGLCDNWWNNKTICYSVSQFSGENATSFVNLSSTENLKSSGEQFYENYILNLSSGWEDFGLPQWKIVIALFIAWCVVLFVLIRGINSMGKVSYFTAVFPYLILTILLIRGCMLEGSLNGIIYYLKPQFHKLKNPRVWTDALTQIFFSLSCTNGGLITMSSFNKFKNNCFRDAIIVVIINCFTSIYAGFVIFANLGFMASIKNTTVEMVTKGGPGLAFIVYPEAITQMPFAPLWAVLFFIMMVTLGFGSLFSMVETYMSSLQDELTRKKLISKRAHQITLRVIVSVICFLIGVSMTCRGGIYLLTLLDFTISGFPIIILAIGEVVVISYLYDIRQFCKDIFQMTGEKPNWYWKLNWIFFTPFLMIFLLLSILISAKPVAYGDYVFPEVWQKFYLVVSWLIVMPLPVLFLYNYCRGPGCWLLQEYLKPNKNWGPSERIDRDEFLHVIQNRRQQKSIGKSLISFWKKSRGKNDKIAESRQGDEHVENVAELPEEASERNASTQELLGSSRDFFQDKSHVAARIWLKNQSKNSPPESTQPNLSSSLNRLAQEYLDTRASSQPNIVHAGRRSDHSSTGKGRAKHSATTSPLVLTDEAVHVATSGQALNESLTIPDSMKQVIYSSPNF